MTSAKPARRIAIIGGGPRGLWAVEELIERARIPIDVTVFDPYPAGSGAVYRPQQPPHWRLNVNCAIVTTAHDNFNAWRARRGGDTTDAFPPRAEVGQFLADTWSAALQRAPAHVGIRHLPHRVSEVSNDGEGFMVDGTPSTTSWSAPDTTISMLVPWSTKLRVCPSPVSISAPTSLALHGESACAVPP